MNELQMLLTILLVTFSLSHFFCFSNFPNPRIFFCKLSKLDPLWLSSSEICFINYYLGYFFLSKIIQIKVNAASEQLIVVIILKLYMTYEYLWKKKHNSVRQESIHRYFIHTPVHFIQKHNKLGASWHAKNECSRRSDY